MKDLLQALDDILKFDFKQDTEGGSYILKEPENPIDYRHPSKVVNSL